MGRYKSYRERDVRDNQRDNESTRNDFDDGPSRSSPPEAKRWVRPAPETKPADIQPMSEDVVGTVKFYREDKGFGFIAPEGGGKDVFVHASTLNKAGIAGLAEGQRVLMQIGEGAKGREARAVRLPDV
jgi:CspA family cold shock protein